MDESNSMLETALNLIMTNDFVKANSIYIENYYKYPSKIESFYGIIITYILIGRINDCIIFLEKEKKIASISSKIELILMFFNKNEKFRNIDTVSILFNLGLFLYKKKFLEDAVIFFKSVLLIYPGHKKSLILLGEYEIMKNRKFRNGINNIVMASKINFKK